MKKYYLISLALCITVCFTGIAYGQNYFKESFDGGSLPSGWSNSYYIPPPSGCLSTYGCQWVVEPGGTGNPGPATHSGAGYAFYNSHDVDTGNAELATPVINFSTYSTGYNTVSFWMYRDYLASLYFIRDSIAVYINTSAGTSGATKLGTIFRDGFIAPVVLSEGWYKYTFTIPSSFSGSTNYIIFQAGSDFGGFDVYMDDVSVDHIPPCSGTPTVSVTPAGPLTRCIGAVDTLRASPGSDTLAGLHYQWQVSTDTGTTWHNLLNDTNQYKSVLTLKTTLYRVNVKCAVSGVTASSYPVSFFESGAHVKFASLPYEQSFESWQNHCDNNDMPDSSSTVFPVSGNNSWRRDDEGMTYGGWSNNVGLYSPSYYDIAHSARFHSSAAASYSCGEMNFYVNCSADTTHNKELRFYYNNYYGFDGIDVFLSNDSGFHFSLLSHLGFTDNWTQYAVPFFSKAPQTVIKFRATSDHGSNNIYGASDMGIDKVQVLPPCTGKPAAGTINPITPCAGSTFSLALSGATESAELSYKWQQSTDSTSWTTFDSVFVPHNVIYSNTYVRVIVKCNASGQSDTSDVLYIVLKPFYYCYCYPIQPGTTSAPTDNVGNVTILHEASSVVLLNNGIASPIIHNATAINTYSNFDSTVPTPTFYLDSLYRFSVTQITQYDALNPGTIVVYLDLNHNGNFEDVEAATFMISTGTASTPTLSDTFRIPLTAPRGITGMRVKLGINESFPSSCATGLTINGEYEDYLVNIDYPPCTGPLNAGKAKITDTSTCLGYPFKLTDTTHEYKKTGTMWVWQQSPDEVTWYDIGSTVNMDTVTQIFVAKTWYRLKMICIPGADTTYSDTVVVSQSPPYKCYCNIPSFADGGLKDTSDIGGFSINGFVVSKGGPHLSNPAAHFSKESFASNIIDLFVDSTYPVSIYYIMKNAYHADARITLFIDFDNSYQYDAPAERVLTTVTTGSTMSLITTNVTIPHAVIDSVPTGMRLIINNNIAPNIPSDNACGSYTSGETMDFAVRFVKARVGIEKISTLKNIDLYPNPNNGKFVLSFTATQIVKNMQVLIKDMTGRTIIEKNYSNVSGGVKTEIDMQEAPKGVYFAEILADGERAITKVVIK